MRPIDALLRLVLLPAAVCVGAALLGALVSRRSARARDALLALGLAAGFVAALSACGVRPSLPLAVSDSTWQWVVWLAPAGALLGIGLGSVRVPPLAALGLRALLGSAAAGLILRPLIPHAVAAGEAIGRAAVAGVAVAVLWTTSERATRAGRCASAVAAWLVALTAGAALLYQFGSASVMAAAALALAVAVAVTALCAWWARVPVLPSTVAPALALAFVGLLVAGHATLNHGSRVLVPPASVGLLAASAACGCVPRWPLALGLAVVAAGTAAWLAYASVGAWLAPVW